MSKKYNKKSYNAKKSNSNNKSKHNNLNKNNTNKKNANKKNSSKDIEYTTITIEEEKNKNTVTTNENNTKNNTIEQKDVKTSEESNVGEKKPSLQDFTGNAKDIFSTNKQKYENTMSSAVILLTFGVIGLFVEFLALVGAIYLPMLTFQYVLMFLVFSFFLAAGIFSYRKANTYKDGMKSEEEQRNKVDYFLNDLLTDQVLKELKSEELSEEENYVLTIEKLRDMILDKYPEYDKELLESMIDDYLNEHF